MKLKVLEDNNTFIDMYYLGEPGVSYYIEDGDDKILFDVGYSDAFIKNAFDMGVNLSEVNKIVISHGHNDHTGGLKYFFENPKGVELIAHPACFDYKEENGDSIGSPLSKEELNGLCRLNLSKAPIEISNNLIFLGEIPVTNTFESRYPVGKTITGSEEKVDNLIDDSALVYKSAKGLFVITGCSHSGITNILEYAKKICHDNRIYGVIGGFHLFDKNERLEETIKYLQSQNIKLLYPCHCISLKAKIELAKEMPINEVGVGLELEI